MNILFKLEDDVRKQFEKDPCSEEMFFAIKALAEKILVVKKMLNTREAVEMIAHDYATRLWLRVCDGTVINHWTKYIMLNLTSPVFNYGKESRQNSIVATVTDPIDAETFINAMYGSSNYNEYIRAFELKDYLLTMYIDIKDSVLKYSNCADVVFNKYLYLSVLNNLFTERALIGLSDEHDAYVKMIVRLIKKDLYTQSIEDLNSVGFNSIAKILQLESDTRFG